MITKSLDQIAEKDLQDLIDNQVLECKTIEYKQALLVTSDSDKKKFLADVSSFANASGGDLIYGISEDRTKGIPKTLEGLTIANVDGEIRRLENIVRDGIRPRILGIIIQPVNLPNSKVALIVRVPKSWISPHGVPYEDHYKFYSRNTNGKCSMDVGELRSAFNLSETLTERIRNFRVDRISKILANETPVSLNDTAKIALHLIPVISFNPAQRYEISKIASQPKKISSIGASFTSSRYNLDGFLTYYRVEYTNKQPVFVSYVQLFNNGIIEAVEGRMLGPDEDPRKPLSIPSIYYEEELIKSTSEYISILKELNVDLPIFVFLTLVGVKGYRMDVSQNLAWRGEGVDAIDRDVLLLPETIIESYDVRPEDILRPCFDSIWNACGFPKSLNYDESGEWGKGVNWHR